MKKNLHYTYLLFLMFSANLQASHREKRNIKKHTAQPWKNPVKQWIPSQQITCVISRERPPLSKKNIVSLGQAWVRRENDNPFKPKQKKFPKTTNPWFQRTGFNNKPEKLIYRQKKKPLQHSKSLEKPNPVSNNTVVLTKAKQEKKKKEEAPNLVVPVPSIKAVKKVQNDKVLQAPFLQKHQKLENAHKKLAKDYQMLTKKHATQAHDYKSLEKKHKKLNQWCKTLEKRLKSVEEYCKTLDKKCETQAKNHETLAKKSRNLEALYKDLADKGVQLTMQTRMNNLYIKELKQKNALQKESLRDCILFYNNSLLQNEVFYHNSLKENEIFYDYILWLQNFWCRKFLKETEYANSKLYKAKVKFYNKSLALQETAANSNTDQEKEEKELYPEEVSQEEMILNIEPMERNIFTIEEEYTEAPNNANPIIIVNSNNNEVSNNSIQ